MGPIIVQIWKLRKRTVFEADLEVANLSKLIVTAPDFL